MRSPQELVETLYLDNWPRRRRLLYLALAWIAGNAEYLLILGAGPLQAQAFMTLLGAGIALLFAYIFGAVWDDNNKRASLPPSPPNGPGPC
ncbi:hypothetical protein SAMN05216548_114140 [Faunimonas pinastri]|uniref:Uncharacterized protein n=1 Tax=Faunimonas pinastri TaxID=1855383 RepID=A0A1H9N191_9HYPH|nr:hypothetical protein [Faunimonas pinastri]SER29704.1 hypothetical protein SAMN05216548_114140 [Faunimonas pinastri]